MSTTTTTTFLHTSPSSPLLFKNPTTTNNKTHFPPLPFFSLSSKHHSSLSLTSNPIKPFSTTRKIYSSSTPSEPLNPDGNRVNITDEWGEKTEPEPEPVPQNYIASDPPKDEDEWGKEEVEGDVGSSGNGSVGPTSGTEEVSYVEEEDKVGELKRCLVDTVYGLNFGFDAGLEVRAEVLELVNQLEGLNPTVNPVESTQLLDGNWVLVFTAFSELLPLLAAGTIPLVKVEKISQDIDTSNAIILNSVTLSSPFATFSFSASATFEVRSPSRIQVEFKEGTLKPPEIKPTIDLPQNLEIFGQTISLSPLQQSLTPLQDAVVNISHAISGQPPLKLPIPGERSKSWLLITYLDEDLRIARGDGGLFVLAREGSPLLDQ